MTGITKNQMLQSYSESYMLEVAPGERLLIESPLPTLPPLLYGIFKYGNGYFGSVGPAV